jgi:MFS family permease
MGSGICTLALLSLFYFDIGSLPLLYVLVAISSAFNAFQLPAFTAATTQMVPKEMLGRASGLSQLNQALYLLASPVIAGVLMSFYEIWVIFAIDMTTFLIAVITLLMVKIPKLEKAPVKDIDFKPTFFSEAMEGWNYIRQRPGLVWLLMLFASLNLTVGFVNALIQPLILSFTTPANLGTTISLASLGILVGSIALSAFGEPKNKAFGLVAYSVLYGVALVIVGLQPNLLIIGGGFFLLLFTVPLIQGCNQVLWQTKTDPSLQGRVFAMRNMISTSATPIAYVIAGPLADIVFEPMMAGENATGQFFGQIIGFGSGRGIALMYVLVGLFSITFTLIAWASPRLRHVDREIPDTVEAENKESDSSLTSAAEA